MAGKTLVVGLVGCGLVGKALLLQIQEHRSALKSQHGLVLNVVGIARSKKMLLLTPGEGDADAHIDLATWTQQLDEQSVQTDLGLFVDHIRKIGEGSSAVICDCTASEQTSELYCDWLQRELHVVTANKKANSGPFETYQKLRQGKGRFLYEANVGAGLPIISSIRDMLMTGDRFIEIQGIFSGTLSYIFNEFDGTDTFSSTVAKAKANGFTEPDPREDLSGMDVARKVVILAREIGLSVELGDVPVQSLVPDALSDQASVSVEQFMDKLSDYDSEKSTEAKEAREAQQKLRYVGVIDVARARCSVELRRYSNAHQFGGLQGSDNIVLLRTARYDAQPLTIQGPGAGADVTAAGVFADLLHLA